MENKTCKDRISAELKSRIDDLNTLWKSYCKGEESTEDLGNIYEYGLSFDYIPSEGRKRGYFRYQLSWGGPSDEFRIFAEKVNDYKFNVDKIEYWFMDWFDSAKRTLTGKKLDLIEEIFSSLFVDTGTANSEYIKTVEENEDY